jgi:hypothetical protein
VLIEDHLREEVHYREALALGLDREDAVMRRRLRQKMEFLTESGGGLMKPSDAELEAHLAANLDRFTPQPRVAFTQVFLGDDAPEAEVATHKCGSGGRGRPGRFRPEDAPAGRWRARARLLGRRHLRRWLLRRAGRAAAG